MSKSMQKKKSFDSCLYKPPGLDSAIPSERCDGITDFATKFILRWAHHWSRLVQENKLILLRVQLIFLIFVTLMKSRTWWNVWLFSSISLQPTMAKFTFLCFSLPVIPTLSVSGCTGYLVLLLHPEQFQLILDLSPLIFFVTHTLQISRAISLWGSCWALLAGFPPDSLKISASWTGSMLWMLMSGPGPKRAHLSAQPGH